MKKPRKPLYIAFTLLALFILWTAAVRYCDVQTIGPNGSSVGLAALNRFVHQLTGVHFSMYIITDWLGLVPIGVCLIFAALGMKQRINRKSLRKVDRSLLVLGGFYLVVMAVYVFFEIHVINYRPVLISGFLESSYPSSTTMLVLCVMPTALMQINRRIKSGALKNGLYFLMGIFTVFMVIGRLISGVHWFSDIVGSILLSAALVMLYASNMT